MACDFNFLVCTQPLTPQACCGVYLSCGQLCPRFVSVHLARLPYSGSLACLCLSLVCGVERPCRLAAWLVPARDDCFPRVYLFYRVQKSPGKIDERGFAWYDRDSIYGVLAQKQGVRALAIVAVRGVYQ